MRRPRLIGIGGAHVDRRGMMGADYIYGASVPGRMIEEVGGGVFNALRTAVQFQTDCTLLSVRGGDAAGELVANEIKRTGIADLSSVFLDRATASYTALLTQDGDVVAALADMSIYETALPRQIARRKTRDAIAESDAVLVDANMSQEAITRLVARCEGKPVYAIAISPAKAVRLRPVLNKIECLFLNQREARAMLALDGDVADWHAERLAQGLNALGLRRCVLSNGAHDVCVMDNGMITRISPPKAQAVVDVTGAGDALAGATLAAILNGKPFAVSVRHGLAAAAITVETARASADFSNLDRFAQMLAQMKPKYLPK
ncbi:MAG: carbohydrate kinase family protein [Rhizobiaceae bacterium]